MIEINTQQRILTALGLVIICFLMIKYDLYLILFFDYFYKNLYHPNQREEGEYDQLNSI